ncbi:1-acyl-sn-glycerol-3-phosphate acyltransferase [Guyparkeria sp. SCN-R1]|uniref:lysophospholipid acyltransferase family protein n=1 Tax=Guyparkeria sp. SCN-R1 TaxID=2341113 RepID=UPI000F6465B7|nr:lysophospholipid acyltransferase family protein [Guyparkeria sp. SCN-R1]RRQ24003.1 1-acyl-sn-glycerol-3-phosphate acyltransferase [Guyparkeria sp. SCN-R1]
MAGIVNTRLIKLLRAVHRPIAGLLGHGGLALLLIGWLPIALVIVVLPRPTRRAAARRLIHHAMQAYRVWLTLIGVLRIDSRTLDTLRDAPAGVIVANHPSLLDALIVLSHAPNVVCVMRAGLLRNPMFALPARLAGYLPNDHPVEMMLGAREAIRNGCHVLLFPEGSRTPSGTEKATGPFHPAPFMLASRAGAPLHAFVFRYDRPLLTKELPVWQLPPLPVHLHVDALTNVPDATGDHGPHQAARDWRQCFERQLVTP